MTMHLQPVFYSPDLAEIVLRLAAIEGILSDLRGLATMNVAGTARIIEGDTAIMASIADVNSALDALDSRTTEEAEEIRAAVDELLARNDPALTAIVERLSGAADRVDGLSNEVREQVPTEEPPAETTRRRTAF